MGSPAAKQGDRIVAIDTHIILVPTPSGAPVPTPLPHPFSGIINGNLSSNVNIMGMPAATARDPKRPASPIVGSGDGSTAANLPPHIPQGGPFQKPPANKAEIIKGSATVLINGKPAARSGDTALTCNDPTDLSVGQVVAVGTVLIGG